MESHSVFPTPIASFSNFITEEERLELFKTIMKFKHVRHNAIIGSGGSTHTKNINFVDVKLKRRMQGAIDEYVNLYGCTPTNLDMLWSNVQHSGSKLIEHTHPHCDLSGALYINAKDFLYFHNPNPYVWCSDIAKNTDYNNEWFKIPVSNCLLLIFPSWLKHGKNDVVNTMDNRVVISFNASRMRYVG